MIPKDCPLPDKNKLKTILTHECSNWVLRVGVGEHYEYYWRPICQGCSYEGQRITPAQRIVLDHLKEKANYYNHPSKSE